MAKVHGRIGNGEAVVVIALFQSVAQLHQVTDRVVHQFDGVDAARRIAGVARLALHANHMGEMAFVRAHRLQRGRLANNGAVWTNARCFREVLSARHGGFFIGGGENVERLAQFADVDVAQRVENKGEEALHVGGAQAVELVVMLRQGKGIARPAPVVERHRVGVTRQQQAAGALAGARQHIEFMARAGHGLHFDAEAQIAKPACQQID